MRDLLCFTNDGARQWFDLCARYGLANKSSEADNICHGPGCFCDYVPVVLPRQSCGKLQMGERSLTTCKKSMGKVQMWFAWQTVDRMVNAKRDSALDCKMVKSLHKPEPGHNLLKDLKPSGPPDYTLFFFLHKNPYISMRCQCQAGWQASGMGSTVHFAPRAPI